MKVQLYVEGKRVDMYGDETISVNCSAQNVADISKLYIDYSQSFTLPASPTNNAIFNYFYESALDQTIDFNIRLDARLEINGILFRYGKLEVESASVENLRVENYKVTFYGTVKTLKDLIGEDMLSDLDLSPYNHPYDGVEVYNRVIDGTTNYDVRYPLISSQRIWNWQGQDASLYFPDWIPSGLNQDNIHATSGAIHYDELFPAIKVSKVFQAIADTYGVQFAGTFLSDKRFTNLYLWCKNKNLFDIFSEAYFFEFASVVPAYLEYDLTSAFEFPHTIRVQEISGVIYHLIELNVTNVSVSDDYYIDVYQNGNLYNTITGFGVNTYTLFYGNQANGMNIEFTFTIRARVPMVVDSELKYSVGYISGGVGVTDYALSYNNQITILLDIDIASYVPEMKVENFMQGIFKMFNLVCYSEDGVKYTFEPLETWYQAGDIYDITEYVNTESISVSKVPLYQKISMAFQKSECFMNKQFSQVFMREYGSTTWQYDYTSGEFNIELPFEQLLFNKFTGTDLQVGYSLNNEFSSYVPQPVLLYQYEDMSCDFRFYDSTGTQHITNYVPFGQDVFYNTQNYASNFAPETSTLLLTPIENSLFAIYYFDYLYNLYDLKQRLVGVSALLPLSFVTNFKLNDRVLIRDKRYIINDITINLNTKEAELNLLNDFRPLSADIIIPISQGNVDVNVPISLPNNAVSAYITNSTVQQYIADSTDLAMLVTENGMQLITESPIELYPTYIEESTIITISPYKLPNSVIYIYANITLQNGDEIVQTYTIINNYE